MTIKKRARRFGLFGKRITNTLSQIINGCCLGEKTGYYTALKYIFQPF
jgi:hypothetical protein